MKDKVKIEFDKYELGILLNSIIEYRNNKIKEEVSTDSIDDLYIKVADTYDKFQNQCPLLKFTRKENVR